MKAVKPIKILISFALVVILICSSFGAIAGTIKNEKDSNSANHLSVKADTHTITISFSESKLKSTSLSKLEDGISDIVISNKTDEEKSPSIVANDKNAMVAYESYVDNQTHVYLKNSKDYGATWSDPYELNLSGVYNNYDLTASDIDIKPGSNLAYVAAVSSYENSSAFGYFRISDISSNIITTQEKKVDWSTYNFSGFSDTNIINYDNSTTPWVIALIGTTTYEDPVSGEGPCTDAPMFSYNDIEHPGENVSIAWFPNIQHCSNLSITNEYGNDMIYGICEINNGSNQDLLFFKGNPLLWSPDDAELINHTISSDGNLLHPRIAVKGNDIYIVAETDTDGIVMYRSTNGGDTWEEPTMVTKDILAPSSVPTYPNIVLDGSDWICTFIESGNLSLTKSNNSGANWTTPLKINDVNNSIVSGYNCYDIANKDQIVWTDNRDGNYDIYYQLNYVPSIDLKVVSFGLSKENILLPVNNFVTIIVKNDGDGYAENVLINIKYECDDGNITTIQNTAIITRIDSNQTKTVTTTLFNLKLQDIFQAFVDFAGITNITVTVDPNQQKGDTNYDNNALTKSFEYKDIFLRFWRFENFFKRLK